METYVYFTEQYKKDTQAHGIEEAILHFDNTALSNSHTLKDKGGLFLYSTNNNKHRHLFTFKDFDDGEIRIFVFIRSVVNELYRQDNSVDNIDWDFIYNSLVKKVGFSVDSGLIERLGYELVGRSETAVSELIKNAYDADATVVDVTFADLGTNHSYISISDNGIGMSDSQLINGFMRISSTEKFHQPNSVRHNRVRAGRKGIGRFATQRLGNELTIISQTIKSDNAIRFDILWTKYKLDTDLLSVRFPLRYEPKIVDEGTKLIIKGLKDEWNLKSIETIYRYILDLFQPEYLSEVSQKLEMARQTDEKFVVNFYIENAGIRNRIELPQPIPYDKAIAVIEASIDQYHNAKVWLNSNILNLSSDRDTITLDNKEFADISNVYLKIYYFIYKKDRYNNLITDKELKLLRDYSKIASGVRLYRNGFRVLPYGEKNDDWTKLDRRYHISSGVNNPISNQNLFGYVEITDTEDKEFIETSSREGLIENSAALQLFEFVHLAIVSANERISSALPKLNVNKEDTETLLKKNNDLLKNVSSLNYALTSIVEARNNPGLFDTKENYVQKIVEVIDDNKQAFTNVKQTFKKISKAITDNSSYIQEKSMLLVLAALGLSIGEFTHEIIQYKPTIYGYLNSLKEVCGDEELNEVENLISAFNDLFAFTKYFSTTVSQNLSREKESIDLLEFVDLFVKTISDDAKQNNIELNVDELEFEVNTIPMHRSEWSSILFNLYSNAKKAIIKKNVFGKILIQVGVEKANVFLKFFDNGIGVPEKDKERIFDAFFTTSTPAKYQASMEEQLTGTGLGLKIVKDIVTSYKGTVSVAEADSDYKTCFKILIPKCI